MPERKRRSEYMKMLKAYPEPLCIEQLCEILGGISTKTGYKLLKEEKISSLKVGREYRVTKVDLVNCNFENKLIFLTKHHTVDIILLSMDGV